MERTIFSEEHDQFRASVRSFFKREAEPNLTQWEKAGIVDRWFFEKAGANGFLAMAAPEKYGGGGVPDFRYSQVLAEEAQYLGLGGIGAGLTLHNDICLPYFTKLATAEQKGRWLPGICSGELITAIAMTEPSAGSDLGAIATTAVRDGDHYLVNGSKTFITNGINADLVIAVVKTDPLQRYRGTSLLVVERGMPGFERGRNLEKIGLHSQDTAELFFSDVVVPIDNLLGEEGAGFGQLMENLAQERLSIAMSSVAAARAAVGWTLDYCRERRAFGRAIGEFQNTKFVLAECTAELEIGQTFVDACVTALNDSRLSAEDAAMAKWWCTELQKRVVDRCLQLHGGYGYMTEYPIARAYVDARIATIYGGTSEIMKEIISRNLGL